MSFSPQEVQSVWEKGKVVTNYDASRWRKDDCGAWIDRKEHGNTKSVYGWEIDHVNPNGGNSISNLRPLQWLNNRAKGAGRTTCVVKSGDTENVASCPHCGNKYLPDTLTCPKCGKAP